MKIAMEPERAKRVNELSKNLPYSVLEIPHFLSIAEGITSDKELQEKLVMGACSLAQQMDVYPDGILMAFYKARRPSEIEPDFKGLNEKSAVIKFAKARDKLIIVIGEALYFDKLLNWLNRKLTPKER